MATEDGTAARVLVVDRDGPGRRELADALREAALEVTTVDTVAAALERLSAGPFGAVVAEVDLPDASGLEVLREVRERHPFLPFVVYTDAGSASLAGEAFAAGASGYVTKAEGPPTVTRRLEPLVRGPESATDGEGQRRYRQLIETSPVPINLFDAEGTTIWGNDAVLDLLGLDSREALVGRSIFEFIHPDDRATAERELATVVGEGVSMGPTDMDLVRADGAVRHILVSTAPGRFRGEPIGQAVAIDVTEYRRTREALDAERRVVDNALDAIPDVFFVVDVAGRLLRWNEAAVEVTGFADGELADRAIPDFVAEEDVGRVVASFETVLEEGSDVVEARIVTSEGERIPHEFRGSRLDDFDGDPVGVVGIARDVSALRERERQLLVLEQMLRHNVRNNLNVILGYAEGIERGRAEDVAPAAGKIRQHSERLLEQAEKEKRLVTMLTDADARQRASLVAVVGDAVESARARFPHADVEFVHADDPQVRAVGGLDLAVEELVENAIVHSDREWPSVRVEVSRTDDGCLVRVADDGPGIPEIEREVLAPDGRIDQLHHGSGVGLWFVHWAARLSDGSVTFEGNEPRGAVVTLRLPGPADG